MLTSVMQALYLDGVKPAVLSRVRCDRNQAASGACLFATK